MINRTINTNLVKKEEVFRILALAEATGSPLLLIGPPGVGKTAAVVDYAKASNGGTLDSKDVFVLETDEGTRSTAIKGNLDLKKLTLDRDYVMNSPISEAKCVVINEIDKASASLRNSLLSVMNEKVIFNGDKNIPCGYDVFIATCNKIPEDEVGSPFWDRFLITFDVNRIRQSDMLAYFAMGHAEYAQNVSINIPEKSDIDAIKLDDGNIKKMLDAVYTKLSDRTLSRIPNLVKNIMCVYQFTEVKAIIKAVELLVGKSEATELAKNLMPAALRAIYDKIELMGACPDFKSYEKSIREINRMAIALKDAGKLSTAEIDDIKLRSNEVQDSLKFLNETTENYGEAQQASSH